MSTICTAHEDRRNAPSNLSETPISTPQFCLRERPSDEKACTQVVYIKRRPVFRVNVCDMAAESVLIERPHDAHREWPPFEVKTPMYEAPTSAFRFKTTNDLLRTWPRSSLSLAVQQTRIVVPTCDTPDVHIHRDRRSLIQGEQRNTIRHLQNAQTSPTANTNARVWMEQISLVPILFRKRTLCPTET